MLFDMHIHSSLSSCSRIAVEDIVEIAGSMGLDGICITDHDTMAIRHYLKEGVQFNGLVVIFGMEYETAEGDFLIFGPFESIEKDLDGVSLLHRVSHQGGVAVAAHPFRQERPVREKMMDSGQLIAVEGLNGRNSELENLQVQKWRKKYHFHETGGSDAHQSHEIGKKVTRFTVPVNSREDLIVAVKNGLCTPESGFILKERQKLMAG